jgi:two-component system, OmpR family, sensor histidine kinase MprB
MAVGSPGGLERAIANLLDNAAKWGPPGAAIELRLRDRELTVSDHGPGIAESDAPHVFERFYRATSARGMPGSGLGLAIVSRVAEAHNATITVESAPGGGTLMRLRFPAITASAPGQAVAGSADPQPETPERFDGASRDQTDHAPLADPARRRGTRLLRSRSR